MKEDYVNQNIHWLLMQTGCRIRHSLMQLTEKHGITVVQLQTLGLMQPGKPIPMNTLSAIMLCDASNITGIVDKLLAQGYIERIEKPEDRRVKMISLTPKGTALRQKVFHEMENHELPEFTQLSSDQRDQLQHILLLLSHSYCRSVKSSK